MTHSKSDIVIPSQGFLSSPVHQSTCLATGIRDVLYSDVLFFLISNTVKESLGPCLEPHSFHRHL